jgi:hypothetical protein
MPPNSVTTNHDSSTDPYPPPSARNAHTHTRSNTESKHLPFTSPSYLAPQPLTDLLHLHPTSIRCHPISTLTLSSLLVFPDSTSILLESQLNTPPPSIHMKQHLSRIYHNTEPGDIITNLLTKSRGKMGAIS